MTSQQVGKAPTAKLDHSDLNAATRVRGLAGNHTLQRKCACAGSQCEKCKKSEGVMLQRAIQTKLAVSEAGDRYEQEADRIADQVLVAPAHAPVTGTPPRIQRFADHSTRPAGAGPKSVESVLSSPGQSLGSALQQDMEQRFGYDFSQVRVHYGPRAEQSAQDVDANAYTVGTDIVFGAARYAPTTFEGRRLLAHELTHVVQQSGSDAIRAGQVNERSALYPTSSARRIARQAAPAFGRACSTVGVNPCQLSRCSTTDQTTAVADIGRGLSYVNSSITALAATPRLSDFTSRAMDWYFGAHDPATVTIVSTRLACIATSLGSAPTQFGCHPNDDSLAYTCAGGAGICGHLARDICFTSQHFAEGDPKKRAITAIHEASHLEGMSTGSSQTNPDIYEHEMGFMDISPSQAVQNADSYALFAAAIGTNRVPLRTLFELSAGGGVAWSPGADPTWYFQGTLGVEFQHPRLNIFHPTLGVGLTLIGEAENPETGVRASRSNLLSLLGGFRLGRPRRTGAGGGLELSLFGGPALSLRERSDPQIGAIVGVAFGYRWRLLDFSVGAGYAYDPRRSSAGLEHTGTVGGTFSLNF
jgi:uncharacterized protein DUF4157/lysine-specific metallo-endopeptidase family protein